MGLFKLRRLRAGELELLKGDDDGAADRGHEAQDERPLLLVAPAALVDPAREQGRVAPVDAVEDEDGHEQAVRHVPGGKNGVGEDEDAPDRQAHRAAAANLVRHKARRQHGDKVDGAQSSGNIVDLWYGILLGRLEIQGKILHHI